MSIKMNKIFKVALLIVFLSGVTAVVNAQVGPGGPGSGAPGAPGVPQDNAVPFDGGLSLILLAAGAGVGAKRRKKIAENV